MTTNATAWWTPTMARRSLAARFGFSATALAWPPRCRPALPPRHWQCPFWRRHTMIDTRPILLATDGSPSAAEAQREALELAQLLDVTLLVVSVAHATLPTVGYSTYGYSNVVAELTQTEKHRVEELL